MNNLNEGDAPKEPSFLQIDSLFKSNQYSNSFLKRPEVIKPSQLLEYKNYPSGFSNKSFELYDNKSRDNVERKPGENKDSSVYNFLNKAFEKQNKYLKINIDEILNKEEDDDDKK